jgi:hypothetical protein
MTRLQSRTKFLACRFAKHLLLLPLVAWMMLTPSAVVRGSGPQRRLLVLYSTRMGGLAPVEMEQGFRSTLYKELADNLDLHIEYIDSIRFPGEEYQLAFRDFLRRKYAGQSF